MKNTLKKILSVALCAMMLLALLPAGFAFAEEPASPPEATQQDPASQDPPANGLPGEDGQPEGDQEGGDAPAAPAQYTVTLNAGEGYFGTAETRQKVFTVTADENGNASFPSLPSVEGYVLPTASAAGKVFNGYTPAYPTGTPITGDTTFTAAYIEQYAVTFHAAPAEGEGAGQLVQSGGLVDEITYYVIKGGAMPAFPAVVGGLGWKPAGWTGTVPETVEADLSFHAKYEPCEVAEYSFTIADADAPKGSFAGESVLRVNVGQKTPAPPRVTENAPWRVDTYGGYAAGAEVTDQTGGSYTLTFKEVDSGTVVFKAGAHGAFADGSAEKSGVYYAGEKVPAAPTDIVPATNDFTFTGFTGYDGGRIVGKDETITYTAAYVGNFTISFDAGAFGAYAASAATTAQYTDGDTLGAPPAEPVALAGFVFDRYEPAYTEGAAVTRSQTYVAQYRPANNDTVLTEYILEGPDAADIGEDYAITLTLKNADGSAPGDNVRVSEWKLSDNNAATIAGQDNTASLTGKLGGSVIVTANVQTRTGGRWRNAGKVYKTVEIKAYTVILYSNFPANEYGEILARKYFYDGSQGGNIGTAVNTYALMQFKLNETYTLNGSGEFNCTNYTLTGWNTVPDGGGTAYSVGQVITVTENVELYAQWAAKASTEVKVSISYYEGEARKITHSTTGLLQSDGSIRVLFLKNQEVQASPTRTVNIGWGQTKTEKLLGWTVNGNSGRTQDVDQGELTAVSSGLYVKNGDTYYISVSARYGTQEDTYPCTFYVLKRGYDSSAVTDQKNYYYVGMGKVTAPADNDTLDYVFNDGGNVDLGEISFGSVDAYIAKKPAAEDIAAYLNEPLSEVANIRWYKIIWTNDGWHVDGILYTVGRYWNIQYVDRDPVTGAEIVVKQELVRDGSAYDLTANAPGSFKSAGVGEGESKLRADGWYYGNTKVNAKTHVIEEMISRDITVVARYKNLYSVTYNFYNENGQVTTKTWYLQIGDAFPKYEGENTTPPVPDGYRFVGWATSTGFGDTFGIPETLTENNLPHDARGIVLYGKLEANEAYKYSIRLMYEKKGVSSSDLDKDASYELLGTLLGKKPLGYKFTKAALEAFKADGARTGFTYYKLAAPGADDSLTIGETELNNVATLYYVRNRVHLTVRHVVKATDALLGTDAPIELLAGESYTAFPKSFPGYEPIDEHKNGLSGKMGDTDETATVYYQARQYKLTYYLNGAPYAAIPAVSVAYTAATPEKADKIADTDGYTYTDWTPRNDDTYAALAGYPASMPAHNVGMYAESTAKAYKIIYYVDNVEQTAWTKSYYYNTSLAGVTLQSYTPPTGYSFSGWDVTALPATMPDEDIKIYGTTTQLDYTVRYYVDDVEQPALGGSYHYDDPITKAALPALATGKEYTAADWSVTNTTANTAAAWPSDNKMPAYSLKLEAWTQTSSFTITYKVDGKTYEPKNAAGVSLYGSFLYGAAIEQAEKPTETGKTFKGWTITNATAGEAAAWPSDNKMPAYNLLLEGGFADDYYVTYMLKPAGGTAYAQLGDVEKYNEGDDIDDLRTAAAAEGYSFSGWKLNGENGTVVTDLGKMGTANITLYGDYTPKQYTVTYYVDGVKADTTKFPAQTVAFGTALSLHDASSLAESGKYALTPASGWTVTEDKANGAAYSGTTMPAYNLRADVEREINKYDLTIYYVDKADRSIELATAYEKTDVDHGTEYKVENPVVAHYNEQADQYTSGVLTEDTVIYVEYEKTKYTVEYRKGDHGTFANETYPLTNGDPLYFGSAMPQFAGSFSDHDEGWYFTGWKLDGEGALIAPSAIPATVSGNAIYVAQWAAVEALTVQADDATREYNGAEQTVDTGFLTPTGLPEGVAIDLSGVTAVATGTNTGDFPTVTTAAEAAKAVVTINGQPDTYGRYKVTVLPGTLTITKRPVVVRAIDQTRIYNGTANINLNSYTVTGLVEGDGVTEADLMISLTLEDPNENVGTYTDKIVASAVDELQNYTVTTENGTLRINPRPVGIWANNQQKLAGAADPALTFWTTGGVIAGDNLHIFCTRVAGEEVGEYPINPHYTPDTNYAVTTHNGVLTIEAQPAYLLTFIVRGGDYGAGTTVYSETFEAGAAITGTPADPAQEGFTFSGWSMTVPARMPAYNVTITGRLTENETPPIDPPPEEFDEDDVPLAAPDFKAWALVNLILAVLTALGSALMLVRYFGKKKREADPARGIQEAAINRKGGWRLGSLIPAIGGIVAFILTEDMKNPMVLVDNWTLLMVAIALIQVAVGTLAWRSEKEAEPAPAEDK